MTISPSLLTPRPTALPSGGDRRRSLQPVWIFRGEGLDFLHNPRAGPNPSELTWRRKQRGVPAEAGSRMSYRIGAYLIDPPAYEVRREGALVPVEPQVL